MSNKNRYLNYIKIVLKKNSLLNEKVQKLQLELSDLKKSKELLSVKEVKEIYGLSRSTLERYRKLGLKLSQPIMNGRLFVCPLELEKFLKTKRNGR